jgi:GNAT superfamily N-acetyltransferase
MSHSRAAETIQPAVLADVPQLANLLVLLFTQEAEFVADRGRQERALRLILESPHIGVVFAARDGDSVVGMASLLFTISTAEGGPACWLEDVVVAPDRRGNGLGSRLLQHAIEYARARGFCRITLQTDHVNAGAIRFYRRHGFVESEMKTLRMLLSHETLNMS